MQFFHLSHTDLDGYTCQFVTKQIYPDGFFTNANYGDEIMVRIEEIIQKMEENPAKEYFFLITDLNLSSEEAAFLQEKTKQFSNLKLQLLDHHISGLETSQQFHWYHLDVTKSASLITYEYFNKPQNLEYLIKAVNAVDIWLQEDLAFEMGKVLMRLIDEAKEISRLTFNAENISYKHYMLQQALQYLPQDNGHILLDEAICSIKKSFFQKDKNDTFDNLLTSYIVDLLNLKSDEMSVEYQGSKGILTFGIQNSSIVGNAFLKANPHFHFFMNVSPRGTFSLRADNKIDVSKMAEAIAGGGGHPNASGGKIKGMKEFFVYHDLRNFIQSLLSEKE
ncbi:DHH family phosphoesterase [Nitratiruptor sp. SB155-2]|uniref:DHH family phosphoesterase n=1 Tax=Nitratiruptor sp. (strain SB155-2) TaxID=387092 RepID=UPI0001586FD8|nr:hypothetical protein [Nitratiruptor sp. SB155-2]BAF70236.1 conserved hypothetical protein [Nitratiruptor sp. SB155-2]